jgi:RNA polymerase sigma-70 factor (ECF subfamily)
MAEVLSVLLARGRRATVTEPEQQSDTGEAEWIARARAGDTSAFERLYRAHAARVNGLCLRMTGNPQTAEDLTQETFVSAWRSLAAFEGRSGFGTWLHRIAVNAVLGRSRSPQGRGEVSLTNEEGEDREFTAPGATDPSLPMDLERLISTLPDGARNVLVLYGVYGYSHEEAADMLGIAVGTCKAQLHRARRLMRERMGPEAFA